MQAVHDYTSVSSTLRSLQAESFATIQAEQKALRAFEQHANTTSPAADQLEIVKKYFLENKKQETLSLPTFTDLTEVKSVVELATANIFCWSSKRMSELMTWRNEEATRFRTFINITKRVATGCALPFLAVTATVETVAYKVLDVHAAWTKQALVHDYKALGSSAAFTIHWTLSTIWRNIFSPKLPVDEAVARISIL